MKISIDPGLTGTGYAIWKNDPDNPIAVGSISPAYNGHYIDRGLDIANQLEVFLTLYPCTDLYIEEPQYMKTGKGQVAADDHSLVKLVYIYGVIIHTCYKFGITPHSVRIVDWKGQLPKDVSTNRLRSMLPHLKNKTYASHTWDAIGIGRHAIFGKSLTNVGKM